MMNKKLMTICFAVVMLTACGGEEREPIPQLSEPEWTTISDTQAVSEAESESVSETETEAVSETEAETTSETEPETEPETESETEPETEPETESETTQAAPSDEYKSFYISKLEEIMLEYDSDDKYFDLYDADKDGVPELFVALGTFHAAGVDVYTFKDGQLIDLGGVGGSFGSAQVYDNGYIAGSYVGMGNEYTGYYRINGNKLEHLLNTSVRQMPDVDDPYTFTNHYYINDEEVTKEEYGYAVSDYSSDKWESVGGHYRMDNETIEEVFNGDN